MMFKNSSSSNNRKSESSDDAQLLQSRSSSSEEHSPGAMHSQNPPGIDGGGGGDEEELQQRIVFINDPARSTDAKGTPAWNTIRTTKYHWYSFLPRNLFEQFRRLAYVFFLIIALLNQIPVLAVFGRAASLIPLASVLVITAIKDGFEDWGRYRSDKAENNRHASVFQHDGFKPKKWKDIQVGDLVRVSANESIPCDMVLLATSDSQSGVAYVQTLNLDGESNLKSRYAHQETLSKHQQHPDELTQPISGVLHCEHPHRDIYEFRAYLDLGAQQQHLPLGPNNIILRGCQLKNTEWVVGVVVYAGQETKVMLNSSGAQSKRSKLEHKMNRETLWFAVFLMVLCLVGGVGTSVWLYKHRDELNRIPYYKRKNLDGGNYLYYGVIGEGVVAFLSVLISAQAIIPLALYISMEFARVGQTYFMTRDKEMFDEETDSRFQCRALNLNEDLGQIDYIFSDKTGTLTENKMVFHTASIKGVMYRKTEAELEDEGTASVGFNPELMRALEASRAADDIHTYFLVLAACNTVVPTWINNNSGERFLEYQAESPDEQALVSAATAYGFRLVERTASSIVLNISGKTERYDILGVHEFDSVRKRMAVVVKCPDKSVKVLVKGADSHMLGLANTAAGSERKAFDLTKLHLSELSGDGLRTLVIAAKELSESEFEEWRKLYSEASTALVGRSEKLAAAASVAEQNLKLLGATGIEDRLQDGVPETISSLREAGIKVWVLTGDKQETAISIGFSSALLTQDMHQIIINGTTKEEVDEALVSAKSEHLATPFDGPFALIIDGNSLVHALSSDLEQKFVDVAVLCQAVICCRLAPYQKASVVTLMRKKNNAVTLSVGDGANDVAMIQAADIGVGITGQEGRQAVMASDYAMGQFRFLKRLLLVHGHWNHQRLCYMVLYIFYRTPVFVVPIFWFILYTAFSPQSPMFDWNGIFYSFYVSGPTIVLAVMDQVVSDKTLMRYPGLYAAGRRNEYYNQKLFWILMLDTLWQGLVLFYVPYFTYRESTLELWSLGSLWIVAIVIVVNLHLAMDVHCWNWLLHLVVWCSIIFTFACQLMFDALAVESFLPHYWSVYHLINTADYWLNLLLIPFLALLPRFLVKLIIHRCFPSDMRIAREAELLKKSTKRSTSLDYKTT